MSLTLTHNTTTETIRSYIKSDIAKQLRDAIARSISRNEIVHVTIDGDSGDVLSSIEVVRDVDTEIDYVMCDYEGVDTMDVWGWTDKTLEFGQDWRLAVHFADRDLCQ